MWPRGPLSDAAEPQRGTSMHREDLLGLDFVEAQVPGTFGTAATADEWPIFTAEKRIKVTAVKFSPATAITGNGTNFATLSCENKALDGTGTTEVASLAFDTPTTDDVASHDEKAITLSVTAANLILVAGQVLSLKKAVGGTGMIIDGKVRVEFEPAGT